MPDETFGIVVEIDPRRAKTGVDVVDRELEGLERQAKVTGEAMSRQLGGGMRQAAREAAAQARAMAQAQRQAAREAAQAARQAAREQADAARTAGAAAKQAARDAAAAARQQAAEVARVATEYRKQAQAAEDAFGRLSRANRAPRRLGDGGAYLPQPGGAGGGALAGGIGRAAGGLVAAYGAREVIQLADAYTSAQNRIRQLTKSTGELAFVQDQLFKSAQRTGSEFGDVVALYQKVGKAALGMGRSQEQAIAITETITKALKASGSEGASATAALQQLGQALDSGVLRGEEFNSVNEQAPKLLDLLAANLGKTRGELRKMAEAGQLTADVVIKAFEDQKAAVDEAYGKRLPTISEQFVRFRNELTKIFGEVASNANVTKVFGAALASIASTLRSMAEVIGTVASGIMAFNNALGGLPGEAVEGLVKYSKYAMPLIGQILAAKDALEYFRGPDQIVAQTEMDVTGREAQDFHQTESRDYSAVYEIQQMQKRFAFIQAGMSKAVKAYRNQQGLTAVDSEQKRQADALARLREEYERLASSLSVTANAQRELAEAEALLDRAQAAGFVTQESTVRLLERKRDLLRDQLDPLGAVFRAIEEETQLLQLSTAERERETEYRGIVNDLRRQGVELSEAETEQLRAALAAQEEARHAAERTATEMERANQAALNMATSFGLGLTAALEDTVGGFFRVSEEVKQANRQMDYLSDSLQGSLARGFDGAIDALVEFTQTGKLEFAGLAQSILADITKIMIKMLLLRAVQAAFGISGGGTGGVGGFLAEIITGTSGGNFAAGGAFTVGGSGGTDSQPVFFRATPGERVTVTPPGQAAVSQSPNVNVPVKVVNTWDPESAVEAMSSSSGERVILNVIAKNRGKLRGMLAG